MRRTTVVMLLVAVLAGGGVPQVTVESAAEDGLAKWQAYSRGSDIDSTRGLLCRLLPQCCDNQR